MTITYDLRITIINESVRSRKNEVNLTNNGLFFENMKHKDDTWFATMNSVDSFNEIRSTANKVLHKQFVYTNARQFGDNFSHFQNSDSEGFFKLTAKCNVESESLTENARTHNGAERRRRQNYNTNPNR